VLHLATVDVSVRYLLLPQLLALKAAGYNVAAACNPGPGTVAAEEADLPFFPVPMERRLLALGHLRTVWRLVRLLRAQDVRLLHVHTPVAAALGRVAAWLARTPVVFYTAHGFYFHERMAARYRKPLVAVEWLLGRITDHLFTQSAEDLETARRHGVATAERSSYLGNGVDVEEFARATAQREAVRRELGLGAGPGAAGPGAADPGAADPGAADPAVVAFTGRFVREKGIAELLEAVARVRGRRPDVRLLIIGGSLPSDRDPAEADLAALVSRLGISEAIITTGFTDRVAGYLSAADIFVLPSYREGMPRSILEAMAAGLPVVATDIRGCREEVVDGTTGYLIPVKDAGALADAIGRLVDEPELRARMGAAGQARARELFDERLVFERLLAVYKRFLPAEAPL
jgi:glycosyltransferase involved in cell wall biosynthesis